MSEARNPRTAGRAGERRAERMNRPPEGSQWFWITVEMASSPAWRALPPQALRVVLRVLIEHANHGGRANGKLTCTYADFERYGIRRKSVNEAVAQAEALGFLDVSPGRLIGGNVRAPSLYRLTWLAGHEGDEPSNRWRAIASEEESQSALAKAAEGRLRRPGPRTRGEPERKALSQNL